MTNLTEIKVTKKSCINVESEMLIVGFYQNKKLNSLHKHLDASLEGQFSRAIKMDQFSGKIKSLLK